MSESQWLSLALVCLLGAMSPGPSLVVVVRQSFAGGSRAGITCAIAHGVGIFLWAAMMVSGLGALVIASPDLFLAFRFAGAVFLIYIGIQSLRATSAGSEEVTAPFDGNHGSPAREGFLIALTNPKIAVFFCRAVQSVYPPGCAGCCAVDDCGHRCDHRYLVVCRGSAAPLPNRGARAIPAPQFIVEPGFRGDTYRLGVLCGLRGVTSWLVLGFFDEALAFAGPLSGLKE